MHALATGLLAMIVAASAIAASEKLTVSFSEIDVNGDGRISVTEAAAHRKLSREFATVDANRDDYVSEREFAVWVSAQADIDNPHRMASLEPWNDLERPQAAIEPLIFRRW